MSPDTRYAIRQHIEAMRNDGTCRQLRKLTMGEEDYFRLHGAFGRHSQEMAEALFLVEHSLAAELREIERLLDEDVKEGTEDDPEDD